MDYTLFAQTVLLLQDNHLVVIGLCLVSAILLSEWLHRLLPHLPAITGYLLTGLLMGPYVLGLLDGENLAQLSLFSDIAIGILLFELGRYLDWRWLRGEPRLVMLILLESLAVFFAVYLLLWGMGLQPLAAGLLAIIAITTSPLILLPVLRESRAEGRVSDWAQVFAAANNMLALVAAVLLVALAHLTQTGGWQQALIGPMRELLGGLALGLLAAWLTCRFLHWLRAHGPHDVLPTLFLFGAVVAVIGTAKALAFSPLLAVLALGFGCRHIESGEAVLGMQLDPLRSLFVCVLFVQLGASLNPSAWQGVAVWALLFLMVRTLARVAIPYLIAPFCGLRHAQGGWLGVVLIPMSSLGLLTVHASVTTLPELDPQAAGIAVAALMVMELLGPISTRWALKQAGEIAEEGRHHVKS